MIRNIGLLSICILKPWCSYGFPVSESLVVEHRESNVKTLVECEGSIQARLGSQRVGVHYPLFNIAMENHHF